MLPNFHKSFIIKMLRVIYHGCYEFEIFANLLKRIKMNMVVISTVTEPSGIFFVDYK